LLTQAEQIDKELNIIRQIAKGLGLKDLDLYATIEMAQIKSGDKGPHAARFNGMHIGSVILIILKEKGMCNLKELSRMAIEGGYQSTSANGINILISSTLSALKKQNQVMNTGIGEWEIYSVDSPAYKRVSLKDRVKDSVLKLMSENRAFHSFKDISDALIGLGYKETSVFHHTINYALYRLRKEKKVREDHVAKDGGWYGIGWIVSDIAESAP